MMSAWLLFIIIPVSVFIGFFFAALCHAASRRDKHDS